MKRYFFFILSILFFCFPKLVFASDGVVQINETVYEIFDEAVEASKSFDTITLLADLDLRNQSFVVYNFPDHVTLDLAGHKIITKNMGAIYTGIYLTIRNGIFETDGSYALFIGDNEDTDQVLLENVKSIGGINVFNATNVTLKDVSAVGHNYYAVWADEHAQIKIVSGDYSTRGNYVLGISTEESSYIHIEGGNFKTTNGNLVLGGDYQKPVITGGSFDTNPSEYIGANARVKQDEDGNYLVGYETSVKYPALENNMTFGIPEADETTNILMNSLKHLNLQNKNLSLQFLVKDTETTKELEKKMEQAIDANYENLKILSLLDVSAQVLDDDTKSVITTLTQLDNKIKFQMFIPEQDKEEGNLTYFVLKRQGDQIIVLDSILSPDAKSLTFESDQFATYALVSASLRKEELKPSENESQEEDLEVENPKTVDSISNILRTLGISLSLFCLSLYYVIKKMSF